MTEPRTISDFRLLYLLNGPLKLGVFVLALVDHAVGTSSQRSLGSEVDVLEPLLVLPDKARFIILELRLLLGVHIDEIKINYLIYI